MSSHYLVKFDPVAFSVFGWPIHWYGLMYLAGFLVGWWLGRWRARQANSGWTLVEVDDLVFYVGMGVILGGRIGYLLFYDFKNLIAEPSLWEMFKHIIAFNKGGMSFHGGLLGVLTALWFFARKYHKTYFNVVDLLALLTPPGLFFGRIGNFINGELWGGPTTLPWGMIFDSAKDGVVRHPSQLYEAGLEGIVLFCVLWWFARKPRPTMAVSGVFAIGYACFRSLVETVRVPDKGIDYLLGTNWLTMGILLSVPLLLVGLGLLWLAYSKKQP
ncbi:MAG: prolipoprotein diacylglyceryl transferase [Gammaproteobacteria bacterium]|nr:prolipoprotein diacylglyceryl transferase [Gammaproteobacteria bacterium]